MAGKLVSIIIPTYNRKKDVLTCLDSLLSISYDNYEIIIVDNASEDNTIAAIKERFVNVKNLKVIEAGENLGASGGRNEGIKHARGEYLCFVDSDNIVDNNFLAELVKLAEADEKIGFVGPKMYYLNDPKRIWCAGATINLLTSKTRYIGKDKIDHGQYDRFRKVEHIPNVWLVKRPVINKIGLMDTTYGICYEESDWAMRAQRAGYSVIFCPTAIVYHNIPLRTKNSGLRGLVGFDNQYTIFRLARNRAIFMKKFANKFSLIIFLLIFNNLFLVLYCAIFVSYGKVDLLNSYVKGYWEGLSS